MLRHKYNFFLNKNYYFFCNSITKSKEHFKLHLSQPHVPLLKYRSRKDFVSHGQATAERVASTVVVTTPQTHDGPWERAEELFQGSPGDQVFAKRSRLEKMLRSPWSKRGREICRRVQIEISDEIKMKIQGLGHSLRDGDTGDWGRTSLHSEEQYPGTLCPGME